VATKITVHEVKTYPSYREVGYLFTLAVPVDQQGKGDLPLGDKKDIYGTASYSLTTAAAQIKADLITRYTAAQTALNNDTSLAYYGITWDGTTWSA
jgi:hypothetical protein